MEEDLETLEVLLSQYAILQEVDPDPPGSDGDLKVINSPCCFPALSPLLVSF